MSTIHRTILYRLLAAWVVVALATAAAGFWFGVRNIDSRLVDLASAEMGKLSAANLSQFNHPESQRGALKDLADEFVREHFIAVEFRNRNRDRIAAAVSPRHAGIAEELGRQADGFPLDGERHHSKFSSDGTTVLRILMPLREAGGSIAGYFEGAFLVDPETLKKLRHEMIITLLIVLFAVTLTAACFYPVMLSLNRDVMRYSNDLLKGNVELMEVLGSAIAKRDAVTNIHNYRVASYAVRLAEAVDLRPADICDLIAGAFLHDVGKIGISDSILLKPGPLDPREREIMRTHVALGVEILKKSNWLQKARHVVEFHHEKYDGGGYLKGLAGDDIPVTARIFAIVDVFDALTSRRPYKEAFPFHEAMAILHQGVGTHFDPRLVAAFAGIAEPLFGEVSNTPDRAVESKLQTLIEKYFFARG